MENDIITHPASVPATPMSLGRELVREKLQELAEDGDIDAIVEYGKENRRMDFQAAIDLMDEDEFTP